MVLKMILLCPLVDGILSVLNWHAWVLSWGWDTFSGIKDPVGSWLIWAIVAALSLCILVIMRNEKNEMALKYPYALALVLIFWPFTWHIVVGILLCFFGSKAVKEIIQGASS